MTGGAADFERCIAQGGIAVFPSDTVYGLACDPENRDAVERLYGLKQRDLGKPSAVMFFGIEPALAGVPELGPRTRAALRRLLPGAVGVVVPNPGRRFPLACGEDTSSLGLRVPALDWAAGVGVAVLQSSANLAGGFDPVRLADVPAAVRAGADLVLDGGELPGTPSTVIDLREFEDAGRWRVLRAGAVAAGEVAAALQAPGQFHFDPRTYLEMMLEEVPDYERLQEELADASGCSGAARILELGTGTGETARRLLARHPAASLVGLDASAEMLAAARRELPAQRVQLIVSRLEDPLPGGQFDLVASALCVHHLAGTLKADLFRRVASVLRPGGRFVLADVVVPEAPADARTPLTPGFDHPSSVAEQLGWLDEAGFAARVTWRSGDLAVLTGDRR